MKKVFSWLLVMSFFGMPLAALAASDKEQYSLDFKERSLIKGRSIADIQKEVPGKQFYEEYYKLKGEGKIVWDIFLVDKKTKKKSLFLTLNDLDGDRGGNIINGFVYLVRTSVPGGEYAYATHRNEDGSSDYSYVLWRYSIKDKKGIKLYDPGANGGAPDEWVVSKDNKYLVVNAEDIVVFNKKGKLLKKFARTNPLLQWPEDDGAALRLGKWKKPHVLGLVLGGPQDSVYTKKLSINLDTMKIIKEK